MQVYYADESAIVKKLNPRGNLLIINFQITEDDYVVIEDTFYEYYFEKNIDDGQCIVRQCEVFHSVSNAEIELFQMMMTTYPEIPHISTTLKMFRNLTLKKLQQSLLELLIRVRNHGKIDESEVPILFDVLSGSHTKKQVMTQYHCSLEEITSAFDKFSNEMQWCYGFNQPFLEHRAEQFNGGDIEFLWNPTSFLIHSKLKKSFLLKFFQNVLYSDNFLDNKEKREFLQLWEKFCGEVLTDATEKKRLVELSSQIAARFQSEMDALYQDVVNWLVEHNRTYTQDILVHVRRTGYSEDKIYAAMRKMGIRAKRGNRRKQELLKIEEERQKQKKVFILTGTSYTEKTTLFKEALKKIPSVVRIVSDTTREPRDEEVDGVDYRFLSADEFIKGLMQNKYAEHNFYNEHYYGIRYESIHSNRDQHIALILDRKGAEFFKQKFEEAVTIFIWQPFSEELEQRIISRGCTNPEEIEKRKDELLFEIGKGLMSDHFLANENPETTVKQITKIISGYIR